MVLKVRKTKTMRNGILGERKDEETSNEDQINIRIENKLKKLAIINVYPPTEISDDETKYCCEILEETVHK